jgi:hypothetical protein
MSLTEIEGMPIFSDDTVNAREANQSTENPRVTKSTDINACNVSIRWFCAQSTFANSWPVNSLYDLANLSRAIGGIFRDRSLWSSIR